MLKFLRKNSVSTKVDEIENIDFGEIYDNVAKVYDFFDEEYSNTGDLEKVKNSLQAKFNSSNRESSDSYIIYKANFLLVFIESIDIEDGKPKVSLGIDTYNLSFLYGNNYIDSYFESMTYDKFYSIDVEFNVVDIKDEIKQKIYFIRQWLLFQEAGYDFGEDETIDEGYLYKKLNIRDESIFNKTSIIPYIPNKAIKQIDKRIDFAYSYLKNILKNEGEVVDITDGFEVKIGEMSYIITKVNAEDSIKENGIYIGVNNIPFQEVEEIYNSIDEKLIDMNDILDEKKRISKLVKNTKQSLLKVFSISDGFVVNSITEDINILIGKYQDLQNRGDTFSITALNLLGLVLDDVRDLEDGIIDNNSYTYNKALDFLVNEDFEGIVDFYIRKMFKLINSNKDIKSIIYKFSNIPEKYWKNMFDNTHASVSLLTRENIKLFMDILSANGQLTFINIVFAKLLEVDQQHLTIDLKKYKDIHKYPVESYIVEDFYELLVTAFVFNCLSTGSQETILKPLRDSLGDFDMSVYVKDIDKFIEDYEEIIYNKFYEEKIQRDSVFIDFLNDELFTVYENLDEFNIDNFIGNVLVPHLLSLLHKEDKQLVTEHITMLEQGTMIEVLDKLGYSEIVKDIVFQSWNEKGFCKEVLFYWGMLEKLPELDSYNKESIERDIELKIEGVLQEFLDREINEFVGTTNDELLDSLTKKIDKFMNILKNKSDGEMQADLLSLGEMPLLHMLNYASTYAKICIAKVKGLNNSIYIKLAEDENDDVVIALLELDTLEDPIGDMMANHPSKEVVSIFTDRYKLTGKTQRIIGTSEKGMLQLLNSQKTLKGGIAIEMAESGTYKVKMKLMEYSLKLSKDIQRILLQDKNEKIVLRLLETQKSIYGKSANWIANKASDKVKMKFIERYKISGDIQKKLAKDSAKIVLYMLNHQKKLRENSGYAVAEHPSLKVRRRFSEWDVREDIALKFAIEETDEKLLLNLLKPGKDEYYTSVMLELAGKDSEKIGLRILEDFKTLPNVILAKLVNHPSLKVRRALTKWNLNEDVMLELAKNESDRELLSNLMANWREDHYNSVLLELAKKDSEKVGRALVADFKTMDGGVLARLIEHPSLKVRRRLASWRLGDNISMKLVEKETDEELLLNLISGEVYYSTELLLELAKKSSKKIGLYILENFKTLDNRIINELNNHSSKKVQEKVKKNFS